MAYNGVDYAYIYNVQGDVIALVDSTGAKVVEYYYDAWGKILSKTGTLATTLGVLNPFRYRGYVYDEETGLYYLRSRYYNPEKARFINADTVLGAIGYPLTHNSYAYCINAPIVRTDDTGKISTWATLINQFQNAAMIAVHSVATRMNPNPKAEIVTVDVLINNLKTMADKKRMSVPPNDSGCGMYIRATIVGRLKRHSHDVYEAGMTSIS